MISFPKFLHEINSLIVAQLNSNIVHFIISNRIFRNEFKISIAVICRQFFYCLMAADICVSRKPPDICQSEGSQGYMLTSPHVSVVLYFSHAFISHTFQIINIICFCYIAHMVHSHVRLSHIFVYLAVMTTQGIQHMQMKATKAERSHALRLRVMKWLRLHYTHKLSTETMR